MQETTQVVSPQLRDLRERRAAWHDGEKAFYGEKRYQEILSASDAVLSELKNQLDVLAARAQAQGFAYFACSHDVNRRPSGISAEFADGRGSYYQHSIGVARLMERYGCPLTWTLEIMLKVRSYIYQLGSFEGIQGGMRRQRVRVPARSS